MIRPHSLAARPGHEPQPQDVLVWRQLDDGRYVVVVPQLFGAALLAISEPYDVWFYQTHWFYQSARAAVEAFAHFKPEHGGEPQGWYRHYDAKGLAHRRPGGRPEWEYIECPKCGGAWPPDSASNQDGRPACGCGWPASGPP